MQVVIDIPEEDWKFIKESDGCRWSRAILEGVINGTPLPKGHGELKDIEALDDSFFKATDYPDAKLSYEEISDILLDAPTILEADKVESEVEE